MTTTIEFPVPVTPRVATILADASEVARSMGATTSIGVEHTFLAMMRDRDSVPAQVITSPGCEPAILAELERGLEPHPPACTIGSSRDRLAAPDDEENLPMGIFAVMVRGRATALIADRAFTI